MNKTFQYDPTDFINYKKEIFRKPYNNNKLAGRPTSNVAQKQEQETQHMTRALFNVKKCMTQHRENNI